VDALCINQADLEERNYQIAPMAQIYSRADKVIVYLGESDCESDAAMDRIEDFERVLSEQDAWSPYRGFQHNLKITLILLLSLLLVGGNESCIRRITKITLPSFNIVM
jgi:hypothetical protein